MQSVFPCRFPSFCLVTYFHCHLKRNCVIVSLDSHGLKELYEDWYLKQHMERDFVKVMYEMQVSSSIVNKNDYHVALNVISLLNLVG